MNLSLDEKIYEKGDLMSLDPKSRDDFSRFLIHLTRDNEDADALENLINILNESKITARNPHCLFKYELDRMNMSVTLKRRFNTVCLTEVPLNQIKSLTGEINRQIKLKPYGLVFWKDDLFDRGVSPAIYINSTGTSLKKYLLEDFRNNFKDIRKLRDLRIEKSESYKEIIQYYSLINIVEEKHNFMWEREWRYNGDLSFNTIDLVGIIAEDPKKFKKMCEKYIVSEKMKIDIRNIPVISPKWSYEELFEELAIHLWNNSIKNK